MHHFTSFVIKSSTVWLYLLFAFLSDLGRNGLWETSLAVSARMAGSPWFLKFSDWVLHLLSFLMTSARDTVPLKLGDKGRVPWAARSPASTEGPTRSVQDQP